MISAIIPTYNEERYIGGCLDSLMQQAGIDDFEVIVADGGSQDKTADIVRSFPEFGSCIRLIDNPRRFQVYGNNAAVTAARGEYITFLSAHAEYEPGYLRKCLDTIQRTGADVVGPVQVAAGTGLLGSAIAWCMSSPFGVGNARFRFTQREEEVDSVFLMFLRRETFLSLGGYDERIAFDEDGEFYNRLRARGGRIVVSPAIRARYFVRGTLHGLSRQMLCYGYWRRFTQALHPQGVPLRIYAPPALLAALAASLLLALGPWKVLAAIVPLAYAAFVLTATVIAVRKIGIAAAAWIPLTIPCMHLAYGIGFWRALFTPLRQVLAGRAPRTAAR